MWNRQKCLSYSRPVAFLIFLPRPARTRIVAAHFRARANGLRRFGLRRPGLILQIFLLALLAAFDFARDGRQMLRLARTCRCASHSRGSALWRRARRLLLRLSRTRLLALLHLNVEQIANRFIVNARHHVFEERERFFLELDDGIFLRVATQADAFLQ